MTNDSVRQQVLSSLETSEERRVLVVGDFFVDEYVEGEMFEISKEGPIPVVRFESRRRAAGAAGNLASSIRNLGANVSVVGVRGADTNGEALKRELDEKGIDTGCLLVVDEMPTSTYTKYRARVESAPSREILRLDVLPRGGIEGEVEARVLEAIELAARGVDGIIVLDQIANLVTDRVLDTLPEIARREGALLHGSSRDRIGAFHDFDLIIPNDLEAFRALDRIVDLDAVEQVGSELKARGRHLQILLTLGPDGMALFPKEGAPSRIASVAENVEDVTGAGDAVASTAILGNIFGWDLRTIAEAASHSAAIALARVGTHHVTREELSARLR